MLPANTNIDGFVYLWTHGTDIGAGNPDPFYDDFAYNYSVADYIAYNSSGTSTPAGFNGNIGAGQGFFVLMTDAATTSETITFENSLRSNAFGNDQFYRSSSTTDYTNNSESRIWLDFITPSGTTNTTLIAYVNGATNDKDRLYDAKNTQGEGLKLYSMINDDAFLIQGRQLPFIDSDQVPLGINITEAGIQSIAINSVEGLFENATQDVFIQDFESGIIHNLRLSPYTFSSTTGIFNDRFILRYTTEALSLNDVEDTSDLIIYIEDGLVKLKSETQLIKSAIVYNVLGQTIVEVDHINNLEHTLQSLNPSKGVLFVKAILNDGRQKIQKIMY